MVMGRASVHRNDPIGFCALCGGDARIIVAAIIFDDQGHRFDSADLTYL
jgi:hypothetical protein